MFRDFDRFDGFNDGLAVADGFDRPYMSPLYRRLNWRFGRPIRRCGPRGCRCGTRHGMRYW